MSAIGPIEVLFLVAVVAVVPLAIRLVAPTPGVTLPLRFACVAQPWAAAGVIASFLLPHRGTLAGALVVPWALVTGLIAMDGVSRLGRAWRRVPEVTVAAGCMMLPIGAAWLLLSRLGVGPLGFEEPVVLLTAVHFHYTAFATPVLIGLAGRFAGGGPIHTAIAATAVAGTPLLAIGFTLSPLLEVVAASLLVAALWALAVFTLVRVVPGVGWAAGVLLAVSSLSILAGMALAALYAWGEFTGIALFSLGRMARIHGPVNGLGFALCGLLGWTLRARNLRSASL